MFMNIQMYIFLEYLIDVSVKIKILKFLLIYIQNLFELFNIFEFKLLRNE